MNIKTWKISGMIYHRDLPTQKEMSVLHWWLWKRAENERRKQNIYDKNAYKRLITIVNDLK